MFLILAVVGIISGVVLELVGITAGDAGQLERILGLACLAMAAAGFVGLLVDDGKRERYGRLSVGAGDLLSVIAMTPIALVCLGVFVLTLVPALYLMLPFFIVWASRPDEPGVVAPPSARGPVHAPAYA